MVAIPASRTLGLYSDSYWLMYLLVALAVCCCARGLWRRCRSWRLGRGQLDDRLDHPRRRLAFLCANLFGQSRTLKRPDTGVPHAMMVWGFLLFAVGTVSLMLQENFALPTFQGGYYLAISLLMDLFAVLALAGVLAAAWRRWGVRPEGLVSRREDGALLVLIGAILLSGLLLEGARLAMTPDPWAGWSPAGLVLSGLLEGLPGPRLGLVHQGLWWAHLLLVVLFVALLPTTKLFHLLAAPASQFFGNPRAAVALPTIDFTDESRTDFGAACLEDLHWKHLLETDACLECGRCEEQCPAAAAGKPLSPQRISQELKEQLSARRQASPESAGTASPPLVGAAISEQALWACTSCRSCEVHCPVVVEHVPRLVELRRHRVLMEAAFPRELQRVFRGLENNGNPWDLSRQSRGDWAAGLDVTLLEDAPDCDTLLWPGCAGAFDDRNRKVARAMVAILGQAGIRFAIPGAAASCCGDAARRLGHEYLYQELARANIELFNGRRVKTIITTCPHCFNTLRNEYPQLGGHYEVVSHVDMIDRLLRSRQLGLIGTPTAAPVSVAYHDACYLGRYNQVFEPPREVLRRLPGVDLVELKRNREAAFCCGGGGGQMWLDDRDGAGLNLQRAMEVQGAGVSQLVTACPFCLTMLTDGLNTRTTGAAMPVRDLAELIVDRLAG